MTHGGNVELQLLQLLDVFSSACSSRMATDKPASIPSTDCSTADAVPSCSYPRFDEKEDEKCVISNFCLQA